MNQKLEPSWDLSWLLCVCVCVCVCVGYLKGLGARQLPGQFLPASTPDRCRRWLSLMSSILTQVRLKAVLASVANTKTCLQRSGRSQKVRNSLVEARDWWGLEQVKEAIVPKWLKFLPPSSKARLIMHRSRLYHALITWLPMHWSRGWSCTDTVTEHGLITWLSCSDHVT